MKNKNEDSALKTLRESVGVTQRSLSQRLDIALSTIGYWESGVKLPRVDKFVALAAALKVSLKTLAQSLHIDASEVPDDLEALINAAYTQKKSLKQVFREKGYNVSDIPDDVQDQKVTDSRQKLQVLNRQIPNELSQMTLADFLELAREMKTVLDNDPSKQ